MAASPIYFRFVNVKGNTALDLQKGSSDNGTPINGYRWVTRENEAQLWSLEYNKEKKAYKIRNRHASGNCVDLSHGESDNGTPVIGCRSITSDNQLWQHLLTSNGRHRFRNLKSGTFLYLKVGSPGEFNRVVGWAASESDTAAQWTLDVVP